MAKFVQLMDGPRNIGVERALGDLEDDVTRGRIVRGQQPGDEADESRLRELTQGQIDADLRPTAQAGGLLPPCAGLERLRQHQFPKRDDEPVLLGEGDERTRQGQAAVRMLPADERLGADEHPARKVDHRLEVQKELVALDGAAQVVLELDAFERTGPELVVEECTLAAPKLLCAVHRGVCFLQQIERGPRRVERAGDADAGRDRNCPPGEHDRP